MTTVWSGRSGKAISTPTRNARRVVAAAARLWLKTIAKWLNAGTRSTRSRTFKSTSARPARRTSRGHQVSMTVTGNGRQSQKWNTTTLSGIGWEGKIVLGTLERVLIIRRRAREVIRIVEWIYVIYFRHRHMKGKFCLHTAYTCLIMSQRFIVKIFSENLLMEICACSSTIRERPAVPDRIIGVNNFKRNFVVSKYH